MHCLVIQELYFCIFANKQKKKQSQRCKNNDIISNPLCKTYAFHLLYVFRLPLILKHFISNVFISTAHVFCIFVVTIGEGHKLESFGTYSTREW